LFSEQIVQKLSTKQPSLESRQLVLQEIAVRIYEPPCDDSGRSNHNHRKTKHDDDERIRRTPPVDDRDEDISGDSAQRYKDVEAAAQAAFESAASAAAAAKAAMELSRGEPRGPGDRRRMQMDPEIEKQDELADGKKSEKIGHDRNYCSEVEIMPEDEANHGNVAVTELKQREPARGKPASVRTKWGF
jgi:vacuolar protein sorting-associated protein IST1